MLLSFFVLKASCFLLSLQDRFHELPNLIAQLGVLLVAVFRSWKDFVCGFKCFIQSFIFILGHTAAGVFQTIRDSGLAGKYKAS